MNGQYYGDRYTPPNLVVKNDLDPDLPEEYLAPLPDLVPVKDAAEMPVGGTLVDAGPVNGPLASVIPIYETPVKEIQNESPVPAADRMDTPVPYRAVSSEAIVEEWGSKPIPANSPAVAEMVHPEPTAANGALSTALLGSEDSDRFRKQWNEIQGKFVDEPRTAVQQADVLVSEVIEQITHMFASEHSTLESQWNQGSEVSTEDLRKALQRYRSFFNRLVV